jgi:hypothetical protein
MFGLRALLRWFGRPRSRRRRSLVVPLFGRVADETNPRHVWANVTLWVEDGSGQPRPVKFCVDSGCSISTIGVEHTAALGLALPSSSERQVDRRVATGVVTINLRLGELRVRFSADRSEIPFVWPFEFWQGRPTGHPILLGLDSIVYQCRWSFDGTPRDAGTPPFGPRLTQDAPFGTFLLEDIR